MAAYRSNVPSHQTPSDPDTPIHSRLVSRLKLLSDSRISIGQRMARFAEGDYSYFSVQEWREIEAHLRDDDGLNQKIQTHRRLYLRSEGMTGVSEFTIDTVTNGAITALMKRCLESSAATEQCSIDLFATPNKRR